MKDYSFYIALTYGVSALGLIFLAVQSYLGMKRAKADALVMRRRRKDS